MPARASSWLGRTCSGHETVGEVALRARSLDEIEAITNPGLRHDVARPNDVRLDFPAQVRDLHAQILLRVSVGSAAPHLTKELLMGERPSALRRERAQNFPLRPRHMDVFAPDCQRARHQVDHEITRFDPCVGVGRFAARRPAQ